MNPNEADRFRSSLLACYSVYGKSLPAEAMGLFYRALDGHSLAEVEGALAAHLRDPESGQYPPKPADLIRHLGVPEDEILELAWAEFRKATRSGRMPDDEALCEVIRRLGGLEILGNRESKDLDFMRGSVQALYSFSKRTERAAIVAGNREALT